MDLDWGDLGESGAPRMVNKPEKRKDQEVPLVIYKSGERIEVGRAILKGDGSIIAQISKDVKVEFKDLLFGNILGDISLNPKVSVPLDMMYHNALKHVHPHIKES